MVDLTWNSTDLNSPQSESGVVHESVANTDHNSDSVLKQGYRVNSILFSTGLMLYAPMNENSGTTINDLSGQNHDGVAGGATPNVNGILGTSAFSYDGSNDESTFDSAYGILDPIPDFSVVMLVKFDNVTAQHTLMQRGGSLDSLDFFSFRQLSDSTLQMRVLDDSVSNNYEFAIQTTWTASTGVWYVLGVRKWYDGADSHMELWVDGVIRASGTDPNQMAGQNATSNPLRIGFAGYSGNYFPGDISWIRVNHVDIGSTAMQTLHDVLTTNGSHVTSKKIS